MASKRTSASDKAHHMSYKSNQTWMKNRKAKLLVAQKRNPENPEIAKALNAISYRRGTPKTTQWSKSQKREAQLIKGFCGYFDKNIYNVNKDIIQGAWGNINKHSKKNVTTSLSTNTKGMFSIKQRAHSKGVSVWV